MNTCRKHRNAWAILVGASILMMPTVVSYSSQVLMGLPVANQDGTLAVAVMITPASEESVGALQFDMRYDTSQYGLVEVAPGSVALGAGKDTMFSEPEPGIVRVVVAGMNSEAIDKGTVATLYLQPTGDSKATPTSGRDVSIGDVVVSDPYGANTSADVAYEESEKPKPEADTEEETAATADTADTGAYEDGAVAPKNESIVAQTTQEAGRPAGNAEPASEPRNTAPRTSTKAPVSPSGRANTVAAAPGVTAADQPASFGFADPVRRDLGTAVGSSPDAAEPASRSSVAADEPERPRTGLFRERPAVYDGGTTSVDAVTENAGTIRGSQSAQNLGAERTRRDTLGVASKVRPGADSSLSRKTASQASAPPMQERYEVAQLRTEEATVKRLQNPTETPSPVAPSVGEKDQNYDLLLILGPVFLLSLLAVGAWKFRPMS